MDMTYSKSKPITRLVYTALMTALVYITTFAIVIPVPFTGGYIHPGDAMVFLSGLLLGPLYGAFAAGIGSALSDLLAGYTFWAGPTLIIKGLMAFSVGMVATRISKRTFHILSATLTLAWVSFTVSMYFLTKQPAKNELLMANTLDTLIADGNLDVTSSSLISKLASTSNYLLILLIALPLLIGILVYFTRRHNKNTLTLQILTSFVFGGIIMIVGYYLTYGILVGNFIVPIMSIPANLVQFIFGFVAASLLTPVILQIKKNAFSSN